MNFWRKSGNKDKQKSNKTTHIQCNGTAEKLFITNVEKFEKKLLFLKELFASEISKLDEYDKQFKDNSRLSKSLYEVLTDKGALGYFIQYLDARGAVSFVKFWLDVESYRSAFENSIDQSDGSRICIQRDDLIVDNSRTTTHSVSHDSLSVSTDCDSLTADSNSLYDISCTGSASETVVELKDIASSQNTDVNKTNLSESSQLKLCKAIIDDAIRIYKKYISFEAPNSIRCSDDLRNRLTENLCDQLTANVFNEIQTFTFHIMENEFFNDFLRSDFHCKHQVDVLTSGNVTLADILHNETALFYFMEFLEQEMCRDILEFWIAVTNFRFNLKNTQSTEILEQLQGDAIILYDKYFSLQATHPLGFPDTIRLDVEQNICGENGRIHVECFDKPLQLIEIVLENNFLKSFLSSQLFFKYLSELISTIQMSNVGRHRRIGSDSSSEISSISTQHTNTLLAMEDKTLVKLKKRSRKNGETTDMNIDTSQFYDPDSLWRRKRAGDLQLGRVTELGRFETAIEPEPDKKGGEWKLGSVMKKLVNPLNNEDKTKEEMAWQIAEMIIKDITTLTMNQEAQHF